MRLRPFVLTKEASRAEKLETRVGPDILNAIKQLDAKQVRSLFKDFLPLDFVALLQAQNPKAFEEAFRWMIQGQLKGAQIGNWMEQLKEHTGREKEDVVGDVYINMLNDDPNSRRKGVLRELLDTGTSSVKFQWGPKGSEQRLDLRQSISTGPQGMQIPYCPTDKKLGINHPLWTINLDNGKLEVEQGMDNGRCTNGEIIGKMTSEEFEALKESPDMQEAVASGMRTLEYEDGTAFLRCTYVANLPRFQEFLRPRVTQTIKQVLDPERKKLGRDIPAEKYQQLAMLEKKEKEGTLTWQQKGALRQLREYFQKKQKDFVAGPTSLDQQVGGEDSRDMHEMIAGEDTAGDAIEEGLQEARQNLAMVLPERELGLLLMVGSKIPIDRLIESVESLMDMRSKDPRRRDTERAVAQEAYKVVQSYQTKDDQTPNTCNTCGATIGDTSSSCPYADQMRGIIDSAYQNSKDINEFEQKMNQSDEQTKKHYQMSGAGSIVNKAFTGTEVEEDDIDLEGLDLSGFESVQEEEETLTERADSQQLKEMLEQNLQGEQKAAYFGTDINSNTVEVSEEDAKKLLQISKILVKTIEDVVDNDLKTDLETYFARHGA